MEKLKNQSLLKNKAYIAGEWVDADDGKTFDVFNPYDQSKILQVPDMGENEVRRAVIAANEAFNDWKSTPARERAVILKKWYRLILDNIDDLTYILTIEQGKPIAEAKDEIAFGADFVEWFAEEGRRVYSEVIPTNHRDRRVWVLKQPIGISAAITPWNFPNAMVTRKCAPALATGCPIILKPAEDTPLSALALTVLLEEAGLPKGLLNVVTARKGDKVGYELCTNPLIRKLSFTGSTRVGKILLNQTTDSLKKVTLELGGNAPFIVFEDADVDAAVEGAFAAKYRCSGQTCICTNRFFIHASLYDTFIEKFIALEKELQVGSGLEASTTIGPLINEKGIQKVEELIADAVSKGAKILRGGRRVKPDTTLFQPTVITNVNPNMRMEYEEIFGPVAAFSTFTSEEEVIDRSNNTEYGLAAYFYTKDVGRVIRVSEALEYGIVGINKGVFSAVEFPFGGIKHSGFGREGSKYGIDDYLEIKTICLSGID